jgi:hypothetical protein
MPDPRVRYTEPFELETHQGMIYRVRIIDMSIDRRVVEMEHMGSIYRDAVDVGTTITIMCTLAPPAPDVSSIPNVSPAVELSSRWRKIHKR